MPAPYRILTVSIVAALMLPAAHAQEPGAKAGYPVGPFRVKPFAGAQIKYDSNIFSRPAAGHSWISIFNGGLEGVAQGNKSQLTLRYALDVGMYENSSADDYDDHKVSANLQFKPSNRHSFTTQAFFNIGHDARGSDDTAIQAAPNEYEDLGASLGYTFGANSSKGQLVLNAAYHEKEYTNNRAATSVLDIDEGALKGTFYWRLAPKTRALAEARITRTDYVDVTTLRDSDLMEYLVGVTWKATAKTSGTVKVGVGERDFDSATRTDESNTHWEAQVTWKPRTYSTVKLNASRRIDNASSAADDFIINTATSADWKHEWSPQWFTRLSGGYTQAKYNQTNNREDDTLNYGAEVGYNIAQDLVVAAGYTYKDRDSTNATFSYDQDVLYLQLNWRP